MGSIEAAHGTEERHGFAGARRAFGGWGAISGPPSCRSSIERQDGARHLAGLHRAEGLVDVAEPAAPADHRVEQHDADDGGRAADGQALDGLAHELGVADGLERVIDPGPARERAYGLD